MTKPEIILNQLALMFPNAKVELNHQNHFELLIAVVLSAQTTDVSVNKVTPMLFSKYPDALALSKAELKDVENRIKTIGLYHNKAKNIIELSKELVEKYNHQVPCKREELERLPGVGRKTANVVLSNACGIPALAVDTHVDRVSKRLGLAKINDTVLQVEQKLMRKFPKTEWQKIHHQLIFFGRYHCLAKNPKCESCPLYDLCVYKDKKKRDL
ncbi:MAG: endonuclease III [Acholeplasmataceae bacterium]|jgi:endonuclease-3|nr:endonuclease III [Acholeplasmataceae bacterium]